MEDKKQIKDVMKYFNCSEQMARKIIKTAVMNGEQERITNLCKNQWNEKEI